MSKEKSETHQHWAVHVAAQANSGQSQKKYCESHSLNLHSLTYWRKVIKNEIAKGKPRFKAVKLTNHARKDSGTYRIDLSEVCSLTLSGDFDTDKVKNLLDILGSKSC